jgi:predicted transcriptional regulator
MPDKPNLELITSVVASYVAQNEIRPDALPDLIMAISKTFAALGQEPTEEPPTTTKATGAQIRKSITPDALISFEDGRPYKMLRRHLSTLGLSPAEYRAKWGLAPDYPMTAPGYSALRSEHAKAAGLGSKTGRNTKAR